LLHHGFFPRVSPVFVVVVVVVSLNNSPLYLLPI